jgi:hypothetical protein
VRDAGYPYFVRMWNFVGSINAIDAGERYQLSAPAVTMRSSPRAITTTSICRPRARSG